MGLMIGTAFHSLRQGVKPSSMNPLRPEHCGVAVEPMLGMLVRCWTITVAIIILSQKHVRIAFLVQWNCSLNTVSSHF
jgi:hypothetical protein